MANITLTETGTWTITILLLDPVTGAPEPVPAGDVFSAASSSAAMGASIVQDANGNPAVFINALTLPGASTMGMSVTVSDDHGDVAFVQGVDYPAPVQPGDISLNVAGAVMGTQPAPTAPAP